MMKLKDVVQEERTKILEWNDGCTGGGIDPMRSYAVEVLNMLDRLVQNNVKGMSPLDNFFGLENLTDEERVYRRISSEIKRVKREDNISTFKEGKLKILARILDNVCGKDAGIVPECHDKVGASSIMPCCRCPTSTTCINNPRRL